MKHIRKYILIGLIALPAAGWLFAQQPPAGGRPGRIENSPEYQALLEEDRALQAQQDSVTHVIERLREQLRTNPANRKALSDQILQLEMQTFEIRTAKGRIVNRINELEQDWVLSQLEGSDGFGETEWPEEPAPEEHFLSRGPRVRNLVYNNFFRDNLPAPDYAALLEAQERELEAVGLVNRYFANYDTLAVLAQTYESVPSEEEANETLERFAALERVNRAIADSVETIWNYIFDNKSYAFDYMLDKLNRDQLLETQETRLSEAMLQLAELRGQTASDQLADYFLRKRVAVENELEVAMLLGLEAARDSLVQVNGQLQSLEFRVPKIRVIERFFIDYEEITFPGTTKYTTQHPIPECRIYERGTIYRILLGRYTAKRAASLFKGAYPLFWHLDEEKKYAYYAGGFATYPEAEAAQQLLKEKGFVRPEIVVWNNGVMRNLSQEPETHTGGYRIELVNTATLPAEIRTVIAEQAEETEISKVGQNLFVVGIFHDRSRAEAVAEAIRAADARMQLRIAEVTE